MYKQLKSDYNNEYGVYLQTYPFSGIIIIIVFDLNLIFLKQLFVYETYLISTITYWLYGNTNALFYKHVII